MIDKQFYLLFIYLFEETDPCCIQICDLLFLVKRNFSLAHRIKVRLLFVKKVINFQFSIKLCEKEFDHIKSNSNFFARSSLFKMSEWFSPFYIESTIEDGEKIRQRVGTLS